MGCKVGCCSVNLNIFLNYNLANQYPHSAASFDEDKMCDKTKSIRMKDCGAGGDHLMTCSPKH